METPREDARCGVCGQSTTTHDAHQHDDGRPARKGKRVAYVVVELRGATAHFQAADDAGRTFKTGASDLAGQLGISPADLLGRQYTCWVEPTEYGVIRSDFTLA
ncbi:MULTISPECIES: hypothetical protein [unclassified Streptomyces]|uniref:hypothetical protein n=1 Tax=unclassified Streptomyces TaxID=2593676 RepID=UPI0022506AD2|nr:MULTISPECIES: hypothetical protein [unclassified Streptomyces]MCX5138613.1 hypothetical protein [Streptomyces sp. NBC_00338]WRZ63284.1 hypothetical protein OG408_05070 [Streptomyces sp. NBC_01257]WSU57259.1 hypothetical protein OG450_05075 [Streptomyces sp. NBC_01104]